MYPLHTSQSSSKAPLPLHSSDPEDEAMDDFERDLDENHADDYRIRLKKRDSERNMTVNFRLSINDGTVMYEVKRASQSWRDGLSNQKATPVLIEFFEQNGIQLIHYAKSNALDYFGYTSCDIQEELYKNIRTAEHPESQLRKKMKISSLKSLVMKYLQDEKVKNKLDEDRRSRDEDRRSRANEFKANLFAYRARQQVVRSMLNALESCLIQERDPLQRAQSVLQQLLYIVNSPAGVLPVWHISGLTVKSRAMLVNGKE